MPRHVGRRIDRRAVDADDRAGAAVLGGEQRDRAVAGAQIENTRAFGQAGEEAAPAFGDLRSFIIGSAGLVETGRDPVIMPIAVPEGFDFRP